MKTFVITEYAKATRELCSGARSLGDEVALISIDRSNMVDGVADIVYAITLPEGSIYEDAFDTIRELVDQKKPDRVFFEPTRRLKIISGRLAASFHTSTVTDVIEFEDGYAKTRFFGGVAVRKSKPVQMPALYTLSSGTFEEDSLNGANQMVELDFITPVLGARLLSTEDLPPQEVDLTEAKRVVGVGRGIAAEEDLDMIRDLCGAINAELGCTRPVTESEGWLPKELYIGISGVTLKPDIYLGIGLSGQMQHTVGVNRARVFMAINKDKNAPVFNQSDYGLIADLYDVVPAITQALKS
jgi:electron transfer flavoprotein alpha subunit